MKRYTIPVTLVNGQTLAVTVLATDEDHATIVATKAFGSASIVEDVHDFLATTEFSALLPQDITDIFERAMDTAGPLPAYAVKQVRWAMQQANRIEAKAIRDEQAAADVLRNLPASERNLVRS